MKIVSILLLGAFVLALSAAELAAPPERLQQWRDHKFAMFIHWGPYSLASAEASWPIMTPTPGGITEAEYRVLPGRFNPVKYDPKAWVRLAKAAGQRYMVFTSKHHDIPLIRTEKRLSRNLKSAELEKELTFH